MAGCKPKYEASYQPSYICPHFNTQLSADYYADLFPDAMSLSGHELDLSFSSPREVPLWNCNMIKELTDFKAAGHADYKDATAQVGLGGMNQQQDYVNAPHFMPRRCTDTNYVGDLFFPTATYFRQAPRVEPHPDGSYHEYVSVRPIFPVDAKIRHSNYGNPRNHVKALCYIGRQADSERGETGWPPYKQPTHLLMAPQPRNKTQYWQAGSAECEREDSINCELPIVAGTQYQQETKEVVRVIGDTMNMGITMQGYDPSLWGDINPPQWQAINSYTYRLKYVNKTIFGPGMYAERFGFSKLSVPIQLPPATTDDPRLYGGQVDQALVASDGLNLVQYQVAPYAESAYGKNHVKWDHSIGSRQNMGHETCAASPFFWTTVEQWRTVGERMSIDHMPYFTPLNKNGKDSRTRPITYRFWDKRESTRLYCQHNPLFTCRTAISVEESSHDYVLDKEGRAVFNQERRSQGPFLGDPIPDMQHYRNAYAYFSVGEDQLHAWNKNVLGMTAATAVKACVPWNYRPMADTCTKKDYEFVDNIPTNGHYFKPKTTMGNRRQMHFAKQVTNNGHSVQDFRNTFMQDPTPRKAGDFSYLSHSKGGTIPPIADPDGLHKLMRASVQQPADYTASRNNFHPAIASHAVPPIASIHHTLMELGVAEFTKVGKQLQSRAFDGVKEKLVDLVAKPILQQMWKEAFNAMAAKFNPRASRTFLKILTGTDNLQEASRIMSDATVGAKWKMILQNGGNYVKDMILDSKLNPFKKTDGAASLDQVNMSPAIMKDDQTFTEQEAAEWDWLTENAERKNAISRTIDAGGKRSNPSGTDMKIFESTEDTESYLKYWEGEDVSLEFAEDAEDLGLKMSAEFATAAADAAGLEAAVVGEIVMGSLAPIMMEVAPLVIITGIMIGVEKLVADEQARKDQAAKEKKAREEVQKREQVSQEYHDELIPLDFTITPGGSETLPWLKDWMEDHILTNLGLYRKFKPDRSGWEIKSHDGTPNPVFSYNDATGTCKMRYDALLKKICTNELCLDHVDPNWIRMNGSSPKGHDLLTAEMVREMRLVDYYIREDEITPMVSRIGTTPSDDEDHDAMEHDAANSDVDLFWWTKGRPFPPIAGVPLSYVRDAMTPLPVVNTSIYKLCQHTGNPLSAWYGPWTPAVVEVFEDGQKNPVDFRVNMANDGFTDTSNVLHQYIPVPVWVGFEKSPTGFVSSEDASIAWPTVLNRRHGGPIADLSFAAPPSATQKIFSDSMDLWQFIWYNERTKFISNSGSHLAYVLPDDHPTTSATTLAPLFIKNGLHRDIALIYREANTQMMWYVAHIEADEGWRPVELDNVGNAGVSSKGDLCVCYADALPPVQKQPIVDGYDLNDFKKPTGIAGFTMAGISGRLRGPWFRWDPSHGGEGRGFNKYTTAFIQVDRVGTDIGCNRGNEQDIQSRMQNAQQYLVQKPDVYTTLQQFFKEVQREVIFSGIDHCEFTGWLCKQFGVVQATQGNPLSVPGSGDTWESNTTVHIYYPYTMSRQRALLFCFRYIWRNHGEVFPKGEGEWDTILRDLVDGNYNNYVERTEIPDWEGMADAVTLTDRDVALKLAPTRTDVGRMLLLTDCDQKLIESGKWATSIWTSLSYGDPMQYQDQFWKFHELGIDLGSIQFQTDRVDLWTQILPILNNLQTHVADPSVKYFAVYERAEQVREARHNYMRISYERQRSELLIDLHEKNIAALGEPALNPEYFTNNLNAQLAKADDGDFKYIAFRMVKMGLAMRWLPNFNVMDATGLKNLGQDTQIFVRCCKEAYEIRGRRQHLEDPVHNSMFWYKDELSDQDAAVYYNPASPGGSVLKTPCIIVSFRGTDINLDGSRLEGEASWKGWFRSLTTSQGDAYTDLKILTGTHMLTERFEKAVRQTQTAYTKIALHNHARDGQELTLYVTGHSLGGSLAMYACNKLPAVTQCHVFNPGVGAEQNYIMMVNELIKKTLKEKFWPFPKALLPGSGELQHPWRTKLWTYKIGGPTMSLFDDDPVSMFSGGIGTTYHYEGAGILPSLQGHSIRNFPEFIRLVERSDTDPPILPGGN